MKVDFETGEQIYSSQVMTWKLDISREEWEGDAGRVGDICFHADSKSRLPGNDYECHVADYWICYTCKKDFNVINKLFLSTENDNGKDISFHTSMTKEMAQKLETKVDIKVIVKSEILKSISLWEIEDYINADGDVMRSIYKGADCEELITFHEGPIEIQATINIVKKENNLTLVPANFVKDMRSIGTIFETSDIKVICNGKIFPCHKTILCARSPVLSRYLLGNSKERKEGEIDIQDSSVEAVELMLEYIYKGELISDIPSVLDLELLKLADRYELMALMELCGESLFRNLSPENYLVTYAEIDIHFQGEAREAFKTKSEKFLKENAKAIVGNKAWIQFAKNFPELSQELVNKLLS